MFVLFNALYGLLSTSFFYLIIAVNNVYACLECGDVDVVISIHDHAWMGCVLLALMT